MAEKRVLFIAHHRMGRSPGQRFRFEQYFDVLEGAGYRCELSYLLDAQDDKTFYSSGSYLSKLGVVVRGCKRRWQDVIRATDYDVVVVYREAIMLGFTAFENLLKARTGKLIFDFDDAIWLLDVSAGNRNVAFLKRPGKTAKILQMADMVFAGNRYLAQYAAQYNDFVRLMPTTIDLDYHQPLPFEQKTKLCVGWTGTETTLKHLLTITPALQELQEKYGERIYFKFVCDHEVAIPGLDLRWERWSLDREIDQLQEFDIGLMPLPQDPWAMGKCGFKALQYMALALPAVVSPVGVNSEIVEDGVTGIHAGQLSDWVPALSMLIERQELRQEMGSAGRRVVEERYSKSAWAASYLRHFEQLTSVFQQPGAKARRA